MVKTLRRLALVTMMLVMGICVVLARNWLPFEHSISQRNILIVGLGAAILALSILFWELRVSMKSWQLPEPEEPPTHTNHIILPPPPVEKDVPPVVAAPPTKKVRPAAPPPAQRSGKIVVGNIEKTIKAAERAESYARHTNGRVKIALDDEPDDESDDA